MLKKLLPTLAAVLLTGSLEANASDANMPPGCIGIAAREFSLSPNLLHALYLTERGRLGVVKKNKNNTYDIGPFQINSLWLPTLAPGGVNAVNLATDALVNARTAAWILKSEILKANGNVWAGVGNYRSKTKKYHDEQVRRVSQKYMHTIELSYQAYVGDCNGQG